MQEFLGIAETEHGIVILHVIFRKKRVDLFALLVSQSAGVVERAYLYVVLDVDQAPFEARR